MGDIGLEVGRGSPGEGARVGDADGEGSAEGNNVGRGAAEQDQRDGVAGRGLPGDLEWLAGRDNLGRNMSARCFMSGLSDQGGRLTSIRGRVMGLPAGSPTGACWAAAALMRKATTEALENMLLIVGGWLFGGIMVLRAESDEGWREWKWVMGLGKECGC